MSTIDLIMPKLGESIMEATILKWHKKPGDKVETDVVRQQNPALFHPDRRRVERG